MVGSGNWRVVAIGGGGGLLLMTRQSPLGGLRHGRGVSVGRQCGMWELGR